MDELYRGWGGWEAEGGQYHPQGDKQQRCVLSRAQKLPQSTWQAQTVVSSSLTPQLQVALSVPISGHIDPVVAWTVVVLQGRKKTSCESRPGHLKHKKNKI